jgi:glycosyltransferase involved in cell wall biosynthesis
MAYDVSIIIACYNEENLLVNSVKEIANVMSQTKYSYELIFIDDCSQDKTRDLILKLADDKSHIKCFFHEQNVGRGGTVCEGIQSAQGKIVGFLDIDLEVHARYIPSILWAIEHEGYDVCTAWRIYKIHLHTIPRHILTVGYRKLVRLFLGTTILDTETGFKFFNREKILPVIEACKNKGWFWDTEVMLLSEKHGLKIKEIPCLFIRRTDKISSVKIISDSIDYFKNIWSFKQQLQNSFSTDDNIKGD